MQDLDFHGLWWLPETPGRRVSGRLSMEDDGLQLMLYDNLNEIVMPESGVIEGGWDYRSYGVIHGVRNDDHREITLFDVYGHELGIPSAYTRTSYVVDVAYLGGHADANEFTRGDVEFDYLRAWSHAPSRNVGSLSERDLLKMRTDRIQLATAHVNDLGTVNLYSGVTGNFNDTSANVTEHCAFSLDSTQPLTAREMVEKLAFPARDLLTVSIGRPIHMSELRLATGDGVRKLVGEAWLQFDQPPADETAASQHTKVFDYQTPTMLTAQTMAGGAVSITADQILERWFCLRDEHEEALVHLTSPSNAPFIYPEHRYTSTFQAAEAFHKSAMLGSQDVSKEEHRKRVADVVGALQDADLDPGTVQWAQNVIQGRNDKSLASRIDELVQASGTVGIAIQKATPEFGQKTAQLRGRFSHGGGRAGASQQLRHWHELTLRWLIRGHLLAQLLDDDKQAIDEFWGRLAEREYFKSVIEYLAATHAQQPSPAA